MSGVAVIVSKLIGNAALTAEVPAARIMAGVLPLNTVLPAISVMSIDALSRLSVDMAGTARFITERIQVTVVAPTYPNKEQVLALVRQALPNVHGTVNGVNCDSILPDGVGPDLDDSETQIYEKSRDYVVRWSES